MALTLADLRKQRASTDFSSITAALTKKTSYAKDDEGFWKPERDKAGNATATIRFLPTHAEDDLPWVQLYSHSFQHPENKKWFVDNCPTTLDRDECPVCAMNKEAYKNGKETPQAKLAQKRSRKLNYISNILVVKDPANPENEGKVFRFKFGKKIHEMITQKAEPAFEEDKPVNVFDLWEGANFRIKMSIVDKFPSYDGSSFGPVGPVHEDDEKILEIVNQQISLKKFVAPEQFKTQAELQKRLDFVMNGGAASTSGAEEAARALKETVKSEAKVAGPKPKAAKAPAESTTSEPADLFPDVPDEADMEKYFADMAK